MKTAIRQLPRNATKADMEAYILRLERAMVEKDRRLLKLEDQVERYRKRFASIRALATG